LVTKTPEAVTWLVSAGVSSFALLCLGAWVYEKTRKKIQHPKLGPLVYDWGTWSGLIVHYKPGEPGVRFELPGPKSGPVLADSEALLEFWSGIQVRVQEARCPAWEEFQELAEDYGEEGDAEAELFQEIQEDCLSDESAFENHWWLVSLALSSDDCAYTWCLEFEVSWDPEHTRSAYFDSDANLQDYALSCAAPFDEEED
jgi:hypothetical protein